MKLSKKIAFENIEFIQELFNIENLNIEIYKLILIIFYELISNYSEMEKFKIHLFTALDDENLEIKKLSLELLGKLFLKRTFKYENQIYLLSKCLLDSNISIQMLTKKIFLTIFEKEENSRLFFNIFHCCSKEEEYDVLKITKVLFEEILSNTMKKNSSKFFISSLLENPNQVTSKCLLLLPCQESDIHLIFENLTNSLFENEEILQNVLQFIQKYKGKNIKIIQEIEKIKQKKKKRNFEEIQSQDYSQQVTKYQKHFQLTQE